MKEDNAARGYWNSTPGDRLLMMIHTSGTLTVTMYDSMMNQIGRVKLSDDDLRELVRTRNEMKLAGVADAHRE